MTFFDTNLMLLDNLLVCHFFFASWVLPRIEWLTLVRETEQSFESEFTVLACEVVQ